MTTVGNVVERARSLLNGALAPEYTILDQEWNPGDTTLVMREELRLARGSLVCVGLTTFVVLDPGSESTVVTGIDGSPADVTLPAGTIALVRPRHTTWQVFSEVEATVHELSSPSNGLFAPKSVTMTADPTWGTYAVPPDAHRILRVRYLSPGTPDSWMDTRWSWQPGADTGPVIVAPGVPGGATVQVQYAGVFDAPTNLAEDLAALGIPESYSRLLSVGAARNLSLSSESRRAQPFSQGDPRRAEEVPMGASAMVYDRLRRQFTGLVADERARLNVLWPYRHQWGMA